MRQSKQRQQELLQQYREEQSKLVRDTAGNVIAYFDGACEPRNPGGNMGIGATIRANGKELFRYSSFIKEGRTNSNNVAEYMALESILDFCITNKWQGKNLTIYGDSKLVIEQQWGTWAMKGGFYIPFARSCKQKLSFLKEHGNRINGIWIRREQNKYADELSKAELINNNVSFKIQPLSIDPSK